VCACHILAQGISSVVLDFGEVAIGEAGIQVCVCVCVCVDVCLVCLLSVLLYACPYVLDLIHTVQHSQTLSIENVSDAFVSYRLACSFIVSIRHCKCVAATYTHAHTRTYSSVQECVHTRTHARAHTCTRSHTHTRTHVHTHRLLVDGQPFSGYAAQGVLGKGEAWRGLLRWHVEKLCICLYVCMYVCMYACMYVCMCVYVLCYVVYVSYVMYMGSPACVCVHVGLSPQGPWS
jgi:hypothetical protein